MAQGGFLKRMGGRGLDQLLVVLDTPLGQFIDDVVGRSLKVSYRGRHRMCSGWSGRDGSSEAVPGFVTLRGMIGQVQGGREDAT